MIGDLPIALHLAVLAVLLFALLRREVARLVGWNAHAQAWSHLDAAILPLLLLFALLAGSRLAELL